MSKELFLGNLGRDVTRSGKYLKIFKIKNFK